MCNSRLHQVAALALGNGRCAICVARLGTFDRSLDPAHEPGAGEPGAATGERPVSTGRSSRAARHAPAAAQASQQASTSGAGPASMQRPCSTAGAHADAAGIGPRDAQPGPQAAQQSGQGLRRNGLGIRGGQGGARPGAADLPVECVVVASSSHLTVLQLRAGGPGGAPELVTLDTLALSLDCCCTSLAAVPDGPPDVPGKGAGRRRRMRPDEIGYRAGWTL